MEIGWQDSSVKAPHYVNILACSETNAWVVLVALVWHAKLMFHIAPSPLKCVAQCCCVLRSVGTISDGAILDECQVSLQSLSKRC